MRVWLRVLGASCSQLEPCLSNGAELRQAGLSLMDAAGAADIMWPRLRISADQFAKEAVRRSVARILPIWL
jgi:hypothetical protein